MPTPPYARFGDQAQQRFADGTRGEFERLATMPFLSGAEVDVSALAAPGTFDVVHGLKRAPRGYFVTGIDRASGETGDISIYWRRGERWDSTLIRLYSTGSFELLSLWVF